MLRRTAGAAGGADSCLTFAVCFAEQDGTPLDVNGYAEFLGEEIPQLMSRPPVGALSKAQRLSCQVNNSLIVLQ